MGIAACAALIGARRAPPVLLAGCAALAVEGYATLVHSGGGRQRHAARVPRRGAAGGPGAGRPAGLVGRRGIGRACPRPVGVAAQRLPPVPGDSRGADRRSASGLRRACARSAGPSRSRRPRPEPAGGNGAGRRARGRGVRRAAGPRPGGDRELHARAPRHAIAAHRYSAIITDSPTPPQGYQPSLSLYYRECPQPLLAEVPAAVFRPVAGASRPPRRRYGFPRAGVPARPPSASSTEPVRRLPQ